jgi:hypothetical protein
MKLKSFGCSFVWGSEMADADPYPSRCSWPALLAQHLHMPYQCMARPGGGNLLIAEQILNHVAMPGAGDQLMEPAFFVINWTYIDRFDYANPTNDRWDTIRPGGAWDGQEELADYYFRNLHSQYRDKLTTLMHISLCIDAMQQAGHEFVMTYMDHLLFETQWHTSPAVLRLQEYIRSHMRQFDGRNMLEYSRDRGHDFGLQAHPLETAHADLFQYALANFDIDKIKTA